MKLGAVAVGIRAGGGGIGRVGSFSSVSSGGISVSRPGFTSVRSFGPVASRMKPAGQGFGRGPESRNSTPIRAESKWAKPSPSWNFLRNAPRLTSGISRSVSETSFKSVRPITETKPLRSTERTARFNPFSQRGKERFAYRQAAGRPVESSINPIARNQINEILVSSKPRGSERVISKARTDALRARYGNASAEAVKNTQPVKAEAKPKVENRAKVIEFPGTKSYPGAEASPKSVAHVHIEQSRILAERRARSMQRLQPLIEAQILTRADAQQRVDTALAPQTQKSTRTISETKTQKQTETKKEVMVKRRLRKIIKKAGKEQSELRRRKFYQEDQAAKTKRIEQVSARLDDLSRQSESGQVDGEVLAAALVYTKDQESRAIDQAGKGKFHKDGSWFTRQQQIAKAGESITREKIWVIENSNAPTEIVEEITTRKSTSEEIDKVFNGKNEPTELEEGVIVEIYDRTPVSRLAEKTFNKTSSKEEVIEESVADKGSNTIPASRDQGKSPGFYIVETEILKPASFRDPIKAFQIPSLKDLARAG